LVEPNTSKELKPLDPLPQLTLTSFGNVLPFFIDQFWGESSHGVLPIEDFHVPLESESP